MRHTFIPKSERVLLEREYRIRMAATLCIALASAALAGSVALFPAFIRASLAERSALQAIAFDKASGSGDTQAMQSELSADAGLISLIAADRGAPRISDAIRQIALARSEITLTSMTINRTGTSSVVAVLEGLAPTRDGLLSFKGRLQDIAPSATVDLPIDQLAKSSNIEFSVQLSADLQ